MITRSAIPGLVRIIPVSLVALRDPAMYPARNFGGGGA